MESLVPSLKVQDFTSRMNKKLLQLESLVLAGIKSSRILVKESHEEDYFKNFVALANDIRPNQVTPPNSKQLDATKKMMAWFSDPKKAIQHYDDSVSEDNTPQIRKFQGLGNVMTPGTFSY